MPNHEITVLQQMTASSIGSTITILLVTPLDVVKTRMQSQVKPTSQQKTLMFNSTMDGIIKISKVEGIRTLWSGLMPTLLSNVPSTVSYFTMYENLKKALSARYGDSMAIPFVAGTNARIVAATLFSPMELIRTKMQSEKHSFNDIRNILKQSIRQNGYGVLWQGVIPTLWRDILFSGLYWAGYEQMKRLYLTRFTAENLTFAQSFTCGAISGSVAAILVTPFDVAKTHRQISIGNSMSFCKTDKTWYILKCVYQKHGVSGLFAGIVPRIARIAPSCAIMIGTYEYVKKRLHKTNSQIGSTVK